jgi:hypothetical protein
VARHAGSYRSEKFRKEQKRKKKHEEKQQKRQHVGGESDAGAPAGPEGPAADAESPADVTGEQP